MKDYTFILYLLTMKLQYSSRLHAKPVQVFSRLRCCAPVPFRRLQKRLAVLNIEGYAPVSLGLGTQQRQNSFCHVLGKTNDTIQISDQVVAGINDSLLFRALQSDWNVRLQNMNQRN
jgi:hypothetical protein